LDEDNDDGNDDDQLEEREVERSLVARDLHRSRSRSPMTIGDEALVSPPAFAFLLSRSFHTPISRGPHATQRNVRAFRNPPCNPVTPTSPSRTW
jgi:hypothetical protein